MPVFLIVLGSALAGFLLLAFQQVPLLGCYASGLFTRQTRVFNTLINDPICFSPQLFYFALILSVGLAVLGVYKLMQSSRSAGLNAGPVTIAPNAPEGEGVAPPPPQPQSSPPPSTLPPQMPPPLPQDVIQTQPLPAPPTRPLPAAAPPPAPAVVAKALYITPSGKVVVLTNDKVLAHMGNDVRSFDSVDAFRSATRDDVSVWYEVKDVPMRALFSRLFGSQIVPA